MFHYKQQQQIYETNQPHQICKFPLNFGENRELHIDKLRETEGEKSYLKFKGLHLRLQRTFLCP